MKYTDVPTYTQVTRVSENLFQKFRLKNIEKVDPSEAENETEEQLMARARVFTALGLLTHANFGFNDKLYQRLIESSKKELFNIQSQNYQSKKGRENEKNREEEKKAGGSPQSELSENFIKEFQSSDSEKGSEHEPAEEKFNKKIRSRSQRLGAFIEVLGSERALLKKFSSGDYRAQTI